VSKSRREEVERTRERGEGRKNRGQKDVVFKFKFTLKLKRYLCERLEQGCRERIQRKT
jgi:hypothetical protein